jgi:hypothetical protein
MGKSGQLRAIQDGIAYGGLGFGALAITAPKVFAGVYGLKGDANLMTMIRLWGTAVATLGGIGLTAKDDDTRRTLALATTAFNAVSAVVVATAGAEVTARTRVMGTATSAGFAAAAGYVVSQS